MIASSDDPIDRTLGELHARNIRSVLVEGGATLLKHFIARELWDEARVIRGTSVLGAGTVAPTMPMEAAGVRSVASDTISLYVRGEHPSVPCCW